MEIMHCMNVGSLKLFCCRRGVGFVMCHTKSCSACRAGLAWWQLAGHHRAPPNRHGNWRLEVQLGDQQPLLGALVSPCPPPALGGNPPPTPPLPHTITTPPFSSQASLH